MFRIQQGNESTLQKLKDLAWWNSLRLLSDQIDHIRRF